MCMSALAWAQIGAVVYGTSIETLQKLGIDQILLPAIAVIRAAPFYRGEILGHVLESETDALFGVGVQFVRIVAVSMLNTFNDL